MLFESPVLTWLVLAAILIGLPLLLALAFRISRLVPLKSGIVPFAIFICLVLLISFAVSSFLDSAGDQVIGEVLEKNEALIYHLDGSWSREMDILVKYRMLEVAPAVTERLSLPQTRFDEMHNGDFVKLRSTEGPDLFRLTRLEDQHIYPHLWAVLADRPFFLILAFGLLLLIATRLIFPISVPLLFFMAGLCGIGAWWMSDVAFPLLEQIAVRVGSLDTVRANVREIHQPYFGAGRRAWVFNKLYSPYQLILLDLTPLGRAEPLLSIDVVDPGTATVTPGETITVQYSPGNPRLCLVGEATRRYLWRNYMVTTILAVLALLLVIRVAFLLREQIEASAAGAEE
jgi:hypothetical protein